MLRPIGGPWSLFSRLRVQYQGAICDDISDYNRTHEMMEIPEFVLDFSKGRNRKIKFDVDQEGKIKML